MPFREPSGYSHVVIPAGTGLIDAIFGEVRENVAHGDGVFIIGVFEEVLEDQEGLVFLTGALAGVG